MTNSPKNYLELIPHLLSGDIVVLPTDTLYGVVCVARDAQAVENLYALRQRDGDKPFIILISDPRDIKPFGIELEDVHWRILDSVWPGPVSVILPASNNESAYLHRGLQSLAFRVPANPELRAMLKETGPVVAPTANPQGQPPAKSVAEAQAYFGDSVTIYLDRGTIDGRPSKLIMLNSDGTIHVLRE